MSQAQSPDVAAADIVKLATGPVEPRMYGELVQHGRTLPWGERREIDMSKTDWTFDGTWPYEPKWFDTPDGRLHYIDEGPRDAAPVVMVHGNPTWGYLYRNFIPPLAGAGYRVIVPDLLGAGRSGKPDRPEAYTVRRHAERTEQLLESLDLRDATLVPHDWGMNSLYEVLDELWLGTFPHAVVTRLPDAGHFVQEDAYERVVPALLNHLGSSPRSGGVSAKGQPE